LLLPPFLTHNSDPIGGDKAVPVDVRLDIPELRYIFSFSKKLDLELLSAFQSQVILVE